MCVCVCGGGGEVTASPAAAAAAQHLVWQAWCCVCVCGGGEVTASPAAAAQHLVWQACAVCVCVCVVGGEVTASPAAAAAAQHLVWQAWLGNRVGRASAFPAEAMLTAARSDTHRPHWGGLDTIKLTTHYACLNKKQCQISNIKSYLDQYFNKKKIIFVFLYIVWFVFQRLTQNCLCMYLFSYLSVCLYFIMCYFVVYVFINFCALKRSRTSN